MVDLPHDGMGMRLSDGFDADPETGVFRDSRGDLVAVLRGWEVFRILSDGRLKITDTEALVKWLADALWESVSIPDVAAGFRRLADELEKRAD